MTARRCSLSSAASAPAARSRATIAAFVDQQGEQGADRRRRGRILRGMAGGAEAGRARPRRPLRSQSLRRRITASRPLSETRSIRRSSWMRGREQILARAEPRHLMAAPADRDRLRRPRCASEKCWSVSATRAAARFSYSPPSRRSAVASSILRSAWRAAGSTSKAKPLQPADRIGADADLALGVDQHRKLARALLAEVAHQHRGAAVDEALGEPLVQRVGELLLDRHGALGHRRRRGEPVGAVGDIGPGAHARDAVGERVDVALDIVEPGDLLGIPALRDVAVALAQMAKEARDEPAVMLGAGLAEIGQAAGGPEPADQLGRGRAGADLGIGRRAASARRGRPPRARRGPRAGPAGARAT